MFRTSPAKRDLARVPFAKWAFGLYIPVRRGSDLLLRLFLSYNHQYMMLVSPSFPRFYLLNEVNDERLVYFKYFFSQNSKTVFAKKLVFELMTQCLTSVMNLITNTVIHWFSYNTLIPLWCIWPRRNWRFYFKIPRGNATQQTMEPFTYTARTFCLYRQTNFHRINGEHCQYKTTEIANTRFNSQKSYQEFIILRNSIGNFTFPED